MTISDFCNCLIRIRLFFSETGTPSGRTGKGRRASTVTMDLIQLIVIFCASVISCSFGTLVGGNSLITIPLLVLMGLPPHTAIGTERVGVLGLGLAGLYSFHRKGMMRYHLAFTVGIPCMLGAFVGANLSLQISPELLKKFIVALTVILLIVVAANPRLGVDVETKRPPTTAGRYVLGAFLGLVVGIYNGFYGAGGGTFLSYIMILVFHQTFLGSAANLKVATVLSYTVSTVTYAYHGAINLPVALTMFVGSCIGSYVGAQYSDRIGNVWIKRIFIGVITIMVVKLLMDA
jgi:uncharacterized membrane protein YfcA